MDSRLRRTLIVLAAIALGTVVLLYAALRALEPHRKIEPPRTGSAAPR
jgi:HAMP domain-containing protein